MFSEELDVSKVYRLSTKEIQYTTASMWAVCTSIASDSYDEIFTDSAKSQLIDVLNFDYISKGLEVSNSMTKYIDICYNDTIEKISATCGVLISSIVDPSEWENAVAVLDLNRDIREKIVALFDIPGPINVGISEMHMDVDGNITGLNTSPRVLDPAHKDTQLGVFMKSLADRISCKVTFEHTKGDSGLIVHTHRGYTTRPYTLPKDPTGDRILEFKHSKKKWTKIQSRDLWIDLMVSRYAMMNDEDAAWCKSLFDHDEQEIDFSFEFDGDYNLIDILVYKREAKDFVSWRP
jgi:hypothetical protein